MANDGGLFGPFDLPPMRNGDIASEGELVGAALSLISDPSALSAAERTLRASSPVAETPSLRSAILAGEDPLGAAFLSVRGADQRRTKGAIYTPPAIVRSMVNWAQEQAAPARVVDPGAGSGRFLIAAAQAFPHAVLVAVESDPLAALTLRANVHVLGMTARTRLIVGDYRSAAIEPIRGRTLYIGNPPYVRHHDIEPVWKAWYADSARRFGIKASRLAGLHLHFFLRTLQLGQAGDTGAFITSAEWLDVNYGAALRQMLSQGLGGSALHILDPKLAAFDGTATTAAITCFQVGHRPPALRVRSVRALPALNGLSGGTDIPWSQVESTARWSSLIRPGMAKPAGQIELGELFRVSRGQVSGCNEVWIAGENAVCLPPDVLRPTVTKARELIMAAGSLDTTAGLRRVIDLPADLDTLDSEARIAVERFLVWAKRNGGASGYVARHRRSWWSVQLYPPAPILCTYMARRPPAFVRNLCQARHLNIAHGLYPRTDLTDDQIRRILCYLGRNVTVADGRTYAGGLTKFEPRELERIRMPRLEALPDAATAN